MTGDRGGWRLVSALAVVLVLLAWTLAWAWWTGRSLPVQIALYAATGAVFLAVAAVLPRTSPTRRGWLLAVGVAVLLRAPMWAVPPAMSSDVYRYLWDGAVLAEGHNPYAVQPEAALQGRLPSPELRDLTRRGRGVLERINHPKLRTIYPPGAQAIFALAAKIAPFRLTAWRAILLAVEAATAVALLALLGRMKLPQSLVLLYLWNPLVVFETQAAGHLDAVVALALVLFALALMRRKAVLAAVALAAAVSVKLWPMLLVPLVAFAGGSVRRRLLAGGVFCVLVAATGMLMLSALGKNSGLAAYAGGFHGNEFAFELLRDLTARVAYGSGIGARGRPAARIAAAILASVLIALVARRTRLPAGHHVGTAALLILLLSPVVYPWYYVPVAAMAAVGRRWPLLAWTVLLPLAYAPWGTAARGWLVAAIHLPVWGLLVLELLSRRGQRDLLHA